MAQKGQYVEDASYETVHARIKYERGPAKNYACVDCGQPALDWAYDHSAQNERHDEKGRPYSTDLSTYVALCRVCHRQRDSRPDCRKGHKLTEENTYVRDGRRFCRTCRREYMQDLRARATTTMKEKSSGR